MQLVDVFLIVGLIGRYHPAVLAFLEPNFAQFLFHELDVVVDRVARHQALLALAHEQVAVGVGREIVPLVDDALDGGFVLGLIKA